ncbi:hypothetical protein BH23CHL8_BH23CHL8_32170 [soil metagenome]
MDASLLELRRLMQRHAAVVDAPDSSYRLDKATRLREVGLG